MIGAYSGYQIELSDKITALRDERKLTYKQIADLLTTEGYSSPRGFNLGPESVFSIYKKRKIRRARLEAVIEPILSNVELIWLY